MLELGKLYRYRKVSNINCLGVRTVTLACDKFNIRLKTPCGFWIYDHLDRFKKRWVSDYAVRRFAYPSKKEALLNFIKRSEKHIELTKIKLELAEKGLAEARRIYDEI